MKSSLVSSTENGKGGIDLLFDIKKEKIIINGKKVIAYAITVTKDGPFVDGALGASQGSVVRQGAVPSVVRREDDHHGAGSG